MLWCLALLTISNTQTSHTPNVWLDAISSCSVQIASRETEQTISQRHTGIIAAFFSQTPILAALNEFLKPDV